ncbi:MAG: HEPN domain-containing protein [Candidatus Omnitrophica bacterium]|nr:HEPN domain-containing protein [Candidatus Omnitrophota bacterium]
MKTKNELIREWFKRGEKDLLTATHELSFDKDAVTESVCFHCQQAVEKFIKAYMVLLNIEITKTHEIGELITKCQEKDTEIAEFKETADKLTDYAVEIRYPEAPEVPTLEEAQEAVRVAKSIREFVRKKASNLKQK